MLSLFDSFDIPDVPNVKIYRDDEYPHRFYMVSERAMIARDDDDKPMFTFILYARDVDKLKPDDLEVERGYLAATVQAAVPKEAEDRIRSYLRDKLEKEKAQGIRYLKMYVTETEPELGYPSLWLEGKVEFRALAQDMVPYSAGSSQPSLIGTNVATFIAGLNQDGAELFRQAAAKGTTPAGVWYELTFAARIPAVSIHIYGDRSAFYGEVKNYVRRSYTEYVRICQEQKILGITFSKSEKSYAITHVWNELSSITKFRNEFHSLTIEVDDSGLPDEDKDSMKDKLEEMAFQMLQANILPEFFKQAVDDLAAENNPANQGTSTTTPTVPVNTSVSGILDISISRRELVKQKVNPSAILTEMLTPDEIEKNIVYVDLSNPYFKELDITVRPNVNFKDDPIYGLKVFLDYDQFDEPLAEEVKRTKELFFQDANTPGKFRMIMAKDGDGAPKDRYRYWSELIYKDTGKTIRVPETGFMETRERALTISYQRLGFVKVLLVLGVMPDNVKTVQVNLSYPGYMGQSAKQYFELSRDKPTATFFTYTGNFGDPQPYHYTLEYVLTDGQHMSIPGTPGTDLTDIAETLFIRDPFEATRKTYFVPVADFKTVDRIIVDASYADKAHDLSSDFHAELTGPSATWILGLRDPGLVQFKMWGTILYKDGTKEDLPVRTPNLGTSVYVGNPASVLTITIDPGLIDWTKYKRALLFLEYKDDANGVDVQKEFEFRAENSATLANWQIPLKDKTKTTYQYHLSYIAADPGNNRTVDWTKMTDTILVLQ